MKKIAGIVILIALLITTSACNRSENTSHIGVNAEILEMSKEVHGLVVKALDENSVLGEKCYINCEAPEMHYIYANNETGEAVDLEYEGKNLVKGYRKRFKVDSLCAVTELEMLGCKIDAGYKKQLERTLEDKIKKNKEKKAEEESELLDSLDSDDTFSFIAGYMQVPQYAGLLSMVTGIALGGLGFKED